MFSRLNMRIRNICEDFTIAEFDAVCKSLRKSTPGPDSVSPLFLRHSPPAFRKIILSVLNYSWAKGVLPRDWLTAHVTPIYKGHGAPRNMAKSYRPISLTS